MNTTEFTEWLLFMELNSSKTPLASYSLNSIGFTICPRGSVDNQITAGFSIIISQLIPNLTDETADFRLAWNQTCRGLHGRHTRPSYFISRVSIAGTKKTWLQIDKIRANCGMRIGEQMYGVFEWPGPSL